MVSSGGEGLVRTMCSHLNNTQESGRKEIRRRERGRQASHEKQFENHVDEQDMDTPITIIWKASVNYK